MAEMRAKLVIMDVTDHRPDFEQIDLHFMAVGGKAVQDGYPDDGSDEDNTFARWTPTADLTMTIQNPALFDKFEHGQKFYVDFTRADR